MSIHIKYTDENYDDEGRIVDIITINGEEYQSYDGRYVLISKDILL